MAEESTGDDRVSRQAHERVTRERDEALARVGQLEAVVKDVGIRDKAVSFFEEKGVVNARAAAELALPHLRDVEVDDITSTLASDRFAMLVAGQASSQPPPQEPAVTEPAASGFAGGPNPSSEGAPPSPQKISPRSPEFKAAIARNDRAQIADWDNKGMIDWSQEVLAQEGAPAG